MLNIRLFNISLKLTYALIQVKIFDLILAFVFTKNVYTSHLLSTEKKLNF